MSVHVSTEALKNLKGFLINYTGASKKILNSLAQQIKEQEAWLNEKQKSWISKETKRRADLHNAKRILEQSMSTKSKDSKKHETQFFLAKKDYEEARVKCAQINTYKTRLRLIVAEITREISRFDNFMQQDLSKGINTLNAQLKILGVYTGNLQEQNDGVYFIDGIKYVNGFKAIIDQNKTEQHFPDKVKPGKSILYGNLSDAQIILDEFAGTGERYFGSSQSREVVNTNKIIGLYKGKNGDCMETSRATIHYSGSGAHIVPAHPNPNGGKRG